MDARDSAATWTVRLSRPPLTMTRGSMRLRLDAVGGDAFARTAIHLRTTVARVSSEVWTGSPRVLSSQLIKTSGSATSSLMMEQQRNVTKALPFTADDKRCCHADPIRR